YLLQHVTNPVDWYPWGEKAFAKARREKKAIFLSIGYSTCHWCHVMERESFSNEKIAAAMNKYFVSIKVDREERPDIDKLYMTLASGAGWGGGWPLSMWLTSDLRPFYGGTYFPPEGGYGRPGFFDLINSIGEAWKEKREAIKIDASRLEEVRRENTVISGREADLDAAWLGNAFESLRSGFDKDHGGFGGAPKFPMPVNQNLLLRYYARTGEEKALEMVSKTLEEMSAGGIYDHVGGGFARYSTDERWRVPHFEKMLYDNAQLAVNFLETYQAGRDPRMAGVARETLDYVLRDMTHKDGGFYSAEDADSLPPELAKKGVKDEGHEHKTEGAFYLWTKDEMLAQLGKKDTELLAYRYGVRDEGNAYRDPQGEFKGKNILYAEHSLKKTARKFGISKREAERRSRAALKRLLSVREKRPRPSLDDKVLASWNGLMISAFAKGYQVLEDERYLAAAEKAADFLKKNLYDSSKKRLYHRWREGDRAVEGLADDYAFLIQGLLDLYEASFDPDRLDWALALAERLQTDFYDKGKGGYFMTAEGSSPNLLVRLIQDSDNVEPAASSVAALALLRLAQLTHREDLRKAAEATLRRFGKQMKDQPRSLPQMLAAVDFATAKPRQIIIAGGLEEPATREMLRMVHARFMPTKVLMVLPPGKTKDRLAARAPYLRGMVPIGGKPTAYICVNFACELPTNDLEAVSKMLDDKR
ncbi:MAG: thioredoxin domain-containing protein, partial [Elusimicrobiota bacterium]